MMFLAKYPSRCENCDEKIEIGDLIEYDEHQYVVHVECPEVKERRENPVCPECWIMHAGECA